MLKSTKGKAITKGKAVAVAPAKIKANAKGKAVAVAPTKIKAGTKGKAVAVASAPISTIKDFFNNVPGNPNVCVDERAVDTHAFYVQALQHRLKNYNGEPEKENIGNDCNTVQNEKKGAANDQNNRKCTDGIVESATGDRDQNKGIGIDEGTGTGAVNSGTNGADYDSAVVLDGKNADGLCNASCELLRQKYKDLKKDHFQLCHKHCQLSMKYDQLVETLNAMHIANTSNAEISDMPPSADDVFTQNQIRILQSLPLDKKKDSTFVLQCIEYAYAGNTSTLVNKTLFGTLERKEFGDDGAVVVRPAKDPMTPKKKNRIEELFIKRVVESKCLATEYAERIKPTNIHRLIASALINVSNKEKPKKPKQNVNLNL